MDYSSDQEQNRDTIETDDKYHWIYNRKKPLGLIMLKREEFIDQTPFKSLGKHKVNDESCQAFSSSQEIESNGQNQLHPINDQEIMQDICSKKVKQIKQQQFGFQKIVATSEQNKMQNNMKDQHDKQQKKIQEQAPYIINDFVLLNDQKYQKQAIIHKLTVKTILNTQFSDDVKRIIYEKFFNFAKNNTDKIQMETGETPEVIKLILKFLKGRPIKGKTMHQTAISMYTRQTFLYKIYNTFFKSKNQPSELFYLLPFTKAFFKAIKAIAEEQKKNRRTYPRKFTCFRGAHMSDEQVLHLQNNVGGIIQNLGLLSTSKLQLKAAQIATTTIIQIIVKDVKRDKKTDNGYIYTQKMSAHNQQKQILFNMLNSFRIIQVKLKQQGERGRKYHRITLEYGIEAQLIQQMNQTSNPNRKQISDTDYLVLQQLTNQSLDANNFIQGLIEISAGVYSKATQDYFKKLRGLVVNYFSKLNDKKRQQLLLTNIDNQLNNISLIRQGKFTQTKNYLLSSAQTRPTTATSTSTSMILMKQRSNWVDKKYDKFIIDYISETIKQFQQINLTGCVDILIKYEKKLNEWIKQSDKCIEEQQWQHQLTCCFKLLRFVFNVDGMTQERAVKQVFMEMEKIDFNKLYQDKSILERVIAKQKQKWRVRSSPQHKEHYRIWLDQRKRFLEEPLPQSLLQILRLLNYQKSKQKTNEQNLIKKEDLEQQCFRMCQKIIKVFHGLEEKCKKQTGLSVHNQMKRLLKSAFDLRDSQNNGGDKLDNALSQLANFVNIGFNLFQQPQKIVHIMEFINNLAIAQKHYSTTFYSIYVKYLKNQQKEQESDSELSSSDEGKKKNKKKKKKQKQKKKKI